jgi:hypothetical protein
MADFKDQIDTTEADNVTKLVVDLRAIAAKGQAGEAGITADAIREQISKTQQASLGLFSKVFCGLLNSTHSSVLILDANRFTRRRTLRKPPNRRLRLLKRRRHHPGRVRRRTKRLLSVMFPILERLFMSNGPRSVAYYMIAARRHLSNLHYQKYIGFLNQLLHRRSFYLPRNS